MFRSSFPIIAGLSVAVAGCTPFWSSSDPAAVEAPPVVATTPAVTPAAASAPASSPTPSPAPETAPKIKPLPAEERGGDGGGGGGGL